MKTERRTLGRGEVMEGQNNEIQLEFQMTKDELAEYLGFLKPRTYRVRKGYLCCENDKSRIPCSWYLYRAETHRVLEQFQNPQAVEDDGHVAEGLFNFYFFMDQRAWGDMECQSHFT